MNKSRGRPSGGSDARRRIIEAARQRFATHGYSSTSLRAIARDAGVDHALVSYYFGSKEGLFQAVTELVLTPAHVLDVVKQHGQPKDPGRRLLAACLTAWEDPRYQEQLSSLLRDALSMPDALRLLREYLEKETVGRLIDQLGGDARATARASAAASLLAGLYFTRYLLRLEPVASMRPAQVVTTHGPALSRMLSTCEPRR